MPHPTASCVVRHPSGGHVALDPRIDYDLDDPIVKAYPWAFKKAQPRGKVESVPIEQATAAPGEKRRARKP